MAGPRSQRRSQHRSQQPSKEVWESFKERIREWYLRRNYTCNAIRRLLAGEGLVVTSRQLKIKLSEWKFELKKTPHTHYLAMMAVANFFHHQHGVELEFQVPKREDRFAYPIRTIRKESHRVQKRNPATKLPSLENAKDTLRKNDITYAPRGLCNLVLWEESPAHIWYEQQSFQDLSSQSCSPATMDTPPPQLVPSPTYHYHHTDNDPVLLAQPQYWHFQTYPTQAPPQPDIYYTMLTPESFTTSCSTASSPVSDISLLDAHHQMMTTNESADFAAGLDGTHGTFHGANPVSSSGFTLHETMGGLDLNSTEPDPAIIVDFIEPQSSTLNAHVEMGDELYLYSDLCYKCPPEQQHIDYDFEICISQAIGSLTDSCPIPGANRSVSPQGSHTGTDSSNRLLETPRMNVVKWATPYYVSCFLKSVNAETLKKSKQESLDALRQALDLERLGDNVQILPCLNWTMLVLGSFLRLEQLTDLLDSCCRIISEYQQSSQHMEQYGIYEVIFRYAWAWASDRDQDVEHYGRLLINSADKIKRVWPSENPNFLVSSYLRAYHSIANQNPSQALEILHACLPISERIMGHHDLLTINCLAIASRASAQIGKMNEAAGYLKGAMDAARYLEKGFQPPDVQQSLHRSVLQQLRLTLLDRHATLLLEVLNDQCQSEAIYWRILQLQSLMVGSYSSQTFHAMEQLVSILDQTGRKGVSERLHKYIEKRSSWELECVSCYEKARPLPPPPKMDFKPSELKDLRAGRDVVQWMNKRDAHVHHSLLKRMKTPSSPT